MSPLRQAYVQRAIGTPHELRARAIGALVCTCLVLNLHGLNRADAAPPLPMFGGQWISYQWSCGENSSGWFPGHDDYVRLSAVSTYSILAVSDRHEASVRMQGTVEWSPDSVNRSLQLMTVQPNGSTAWQPLGERIAFGYSHSATVSEDDGKVLSMSGAIALSASYTYPGGPYNVSCLFLQDQPLIPSIYSFGDVNAAVGTFVNAWASGLAQVLGHGDLQTLAGSRPAIVVFHNDSWFLPPLWLSTEELMLQYDRETGFLLEARHRILTTVNVTRTSLWTMSAYILATNMYGPRPVVLLAQAVLAATCIGALVVIGLVSRWFLRGPRRERTA